MTKRERALEWARNYKACLSPESKMGALRGASRDGVLPDCLEMLRVATAVELVESLHQVEITTS